MKTYKISEKRLRELLEAEITLSALNSGGVDNWEWYGVSINDFLEFWLDENTDITYGWDKDDIRFEELQISNIVDEEIKNFAELS